MEKPPPAYNSVVQPGQTTSAATPSAPGFGPPPPVSAATTYSQAPYPSQFTYTQQPTGYHYTTQHGAPVVVPATGTVTTVNIGRRRFGPCSESVQCQHCSQTVTTTTQTKIGLMVWAVAGIILLFGGWLFCCLIPFCIPSLYDVEHTCPNCHRVVGRYDRMGGL